MTTAPMTPGCGCGGSVMTATPVVMGYNLAPGEQLVPGSVQTAEAPAAAAAGEATEAAPPAPTPDAAPSSPSDTAEEAAPPAPTPDAATSEGN